MRPSETRALATRIRAPPARKPGKDLERHPPPTCQPPAPGVLWKPGARRERSTLMAQAAPTPGGMRGRTGSRFAARTARPVHTPDIFDERVHRAARYGIPVVLGLVYGLWAAANRRGGGEITGWNVLFGFVTAAAFIV